MMNESEANLLIALAEFEWPDPAPIFYRLYYRDDGTPICYSMEDLPGNYIEIDAQTYVDSPSNVLVVNGKLKEFCPAGVVTKLKSGTTGTPCSPGDISIVVDLMQPHIKWSLATDEA
jgi:hypothetical protein